MELSMILDHLANYKRYLILHPNFFLAFEFLSKTNLMELADGRIPILGEEMYASVTRTQGKGQENVRLEAHRKYADIQYIVQGQDLIGWRNISSCSLWREPYHAENDIMFCNDPAETTIMVPANHFIIFFPEDTHAPLSGLDVVFKVVVKVLLRSLPLVW